MRRDKGSSIINRRLSLIPENDYTFQNLDQQQLLQDQQSRMYKKIKSFIIRSNQKSQKKSQKKRLQKSSIKSHRVLVHSQQQRQLMSSLGPAILPILVESRQKKENNISNSKVKNKFETKLQKILSNQQKFMKTYFAEIKEFKKSDKYEQEISYIFPEVETNTWKINGYIKGKNILVKGVSKKNRTIIKKYQYSEVYKKIRKNYQKWVKNIFQYQKETGL